MTLLESWNGEAVLIFQDEEESEAAVACRVSYEVVADEVWTGEGNEHVRGLKSWSGSIELTALPAGLPLPFATLTLEDGRTGTVVISEMEFIDITPMGSSWRKVSPGSKVAFIGMGRSPE